MKSNKEKQNYKKKIKNKIKYYKKKLNKVNVINMNWIK